MDSTKAVLLATEVFGTEPWGMGLSWSLRVLYGTRSARSLTCTSLGVWGLWWWNLLWGVTLCPAPLILSLVWVGSSWYCQHSYWYLTHGEYWKLGSQCRHHFGSFQWSWSLHQWGIKRTGETLYNRGLSAPGSTADLKACSITKRLYFISLFLQDLPLEEVQILHLLGIWESPKQCMYWECPSAITKGDGFLKQEESQTEEKFVWTPQ